MIPHRPGAELHAPDWLSRAEYKAASEEERAELMKKAFGAVPGLAMMEEGELRKQALTAASQRERLKRMLTAAEVKEEIAEQKVTTVQEVVKLIEDGTRSLLKKEVGENDADTRIAQLMMNYSLLDKSLGESYIWTAIGGPPKKLLP